MLVFGPSNLPPKSPKSYKINALALVGPVAQRLEQRTHNPLVPGSNPGGPTKLPRSQAAHTPPLTSLTYGRARLTRVLFAALRARPLLPQTEKIAPWTLSRVGVRNPNRKLRHIVSMTCGAFIGRLPRSTPALAATSALGYGLYHQAVWPGAS